MPILPILILLFGAVTALSLVARSRWPMELLSHFRPHFIVAGAIGAVVGLALGTYDWAAISLGLALINYAALPSPVWLKPDPSLAGQPGLTIVWANVWKKQKPLERTLAWAMRQNADLILIGEYPQGDVASALPGDYPHRLDAGAIPAKTRFATRIVVLSRLPVAEPMVRRAIAGRRRDFLTFSIEKDGGGKLDIIAVHPVPPNTPKLLKERNDQIATLPALTGEPFIIAGDFNATPWCVDFTRIPGRRVGSALLAPTWLTSLPLLGLPIDHILVSAGLKASAYKVGPFVGSDHRAVLARVNLPSTRVR